eukprot:1963248-Amphidinium_carterae.2
MGSGMRSPSSREGIWWRRPHPSISPRRSRFKRHILDHVAKSEGETQQSIQNDGAGTEVLKPKYSQGSSRSRSLRCHEFH